MRDLLLEFYLPKLNESKSDGRRILQMISDLLPEFEPEFYNSCEPINKKFKNIDTALGDWGKSFIWKRRKPSAFGMVTFGSAHPRRPFHTSLLLEGQLEAIDVQRLAHFFREFSKIFKPDIGLMHVFPKIGRQTRQPILNLSTFVLSESLPNLYWATIFGRPYAKLFGKNRLLSTPAAVVTELADDTFYIQLTENVMDNRNRSKDVEVARQKAKEHLDSNAFFDAKLSTSHGYRTPEFHIER